MTINNFVSKVPYAMRCFRSTTLVMTGKRNADPGSGNPARNWAGNRLFRTYQIEVKTSTSYQVGSESKGNFAIVQIVRLAHLSTGKAFNIMMRMFIS